jgi:hypothetical protein
MADLAAIEAAAAAAGPLPSVVGNCSETCDALQVQEVTSRRDHD